MRGCRGSARQVREPPTIPQVCLPNSLSGVPGRRVSSLDGLSQGAESGLVTTGGPRSSCSFAGARVQGFVRKKEKK